MDPLTTTVIYLLAQLGAVEIMMPALDLSSPWSLPAFLLAGAVIYAVYRTVSNAFKELTNPLRDLPGPPNTSIIHGNFRELWNGETTNVQERWIEEYGETYRYNGPFFSTRLFSMDVQLVNHILSNHYDYQRPEAITYDIKQILGVIGEGLVTVEGEQHKRQRNIMNPAFGPIQVRELTPIFIEKAIQLRDMWMDEVIKETSDAPTGKALLDALSWFSRTTLDIIGLAGFNYKFNALSGKSKQNDLLNAFAVVFKAGSKFDVISSLRKFLPVFRFLKAARDEETKKAKLKMQTIAKELLEESKSKLAQSKGTGGRTCGSRDLLSLLVRANTAPDLLPWQRLNDSDVQAQIPVFLVAGHETSTCATAWALYTLTQSKEAQRKLREEISRVSTDNPTMDELNDLPYLDAVVRESLRLHTPLAGAIRMAMKDDVIPLSKPFVDRYGQSKHELRIRKGTVVSIPVTHLNRAKSLWGDDAREFKPERWQNLPEAVGSIPGVWGNMMTFLGGPRACIGYRFALIEMKAILFTLVRAFELDLAVPGSHIVKRSAMFQRPVLITDNSNQMPLIIRPVDQD